MICGQDSTSKCYYKTGCDDNAGYVAAGNTCTCDNKYKFSSCPDTAESCETKTCEGKYAIAECKDGYQKENYDCVSGGGLSANDVVLMNQTPITQDITGEEDGYGIKSMGSIAPSPQSTMAPARLTVCTAHPTALS